MDKLTIRDADVAGLPEELDRRPVRELGRDADLIVAIGGDGTMLFAAQLAIGRGVPLLGVNRGRLGFLTDVLPDEMIASVDAANVPNVSGMNLRKPPMFRMSWDLSLSWIRACIAWMTLPAPRKRQALKNACVNRWKKPVANAPAPTPMNMKPS